MLNRDGYDKILLLELLNHHGWVVKPSSKDSSVLARGT